MTMYVTLLEGGNMQESMQNIVEALQSWLYYKMVWTRTHAEELVNGAAELLKDDDCVPNVSIAFQDVYEIITNTE